MSDPAQENQRGCCPDPGLVERLRPASEVSAPSQIRGLGPILCQTKLGQERVPAEARDDRSNPEAVEDVYSQAGSPKHFFLSLSFYLNSGTTHTVKSGFFGH